MKKKNEKLQDASQSAALSRWMKRAGSLSVVGTLPAMIAAEMHEARAEDIPSVATTAAAGNLKSGHRMKRPPLRPDFLRRQKDYRLPHQKNSFDILSPMSGTDDCPGTAIPGGVYTNLAPFTDSGNTTGANNTVSRVHDINYAYYSYACDGPDHVYSFTLTGRGPNPRIEVSTPSSTYRPMIYVLRGDQRERCPAGTNLLAFNGLVVSDSRWSGGNIATLESGQVNYLPLNTALYLFVDSRGNDSTGAGQYSVRMQDVTLGPTAPSAVRPKFDFDGDSRADISVFRPSDRTFYLNRSTTGFAASQFGLSTDQIAPADFDGDGKTDIAVYRDGTWFWLNSSNGVLRQAGWGVAGDTPQPADYSGDGRAELAVFRAGTWFVYNIASGLAVAEQFGIATDFPVAADYDGDGRTEYAVYRDGVWYLSRGTAGFTAFQFGLPTDKLVPADYDGDGKTDLAVFRDGTWYLQKSAQGFAAIQFGAPGDIPVPADYDGNARADLAVFRNGVWYLQQSPSGFAAIPFGLPDDKPVPAAYLR